MEAAGFPNGHVLVASCGHRAGLWPMGLSRSDVYHSQASHSKSSFLAFPTPRKGLRGLQEG